MKYFIVLVNLLICFLSFSNEDLDSIFQSSNELYIKGDYQKALQGYLSIIDDEIDNKYLFYNIGNSYYKLNQLGYARLYFEKAKLYDPGNSDINHNLKILNSKLIDDIQVLPEFILIKWFKNICYFFSLSNWMMIFFINLYLILFVCLLFIFLKSFFYKNILFRLLLILIPLLFISSSALIYSNNFFNNSDFGVLISPNEYVKIAPSKESDDYFIIHNGIKFKIIDSLGEWSRIKFTDGKDGWIQNKNFKKIHK
tara:strand:- start:5490 stop:6251 length:762 start_codon:yes stop_codon:yes gene_type:complete